MSSSQDSSDSLSDLLRRMQAGDQTAKGDAIEYFCNRLQRHAHHMLRGFPRLKRWVQTDDVFQNAMIRLLRALDKVQPASPQHFISLANMQIRRELIDLARHYYGPEGSGAHHATGFAQQASQSSPDSPCEKGETTTEPSELAVWAEFHEHIQSLPDEERQVFDLLWYQEMTQPEAAAFLGMSERTLKRRWQSARLHLHEKFQGRLANW